MNRFPDDWGTPLGADPDRREEPPKKKTSKDSLTGLVYYFKDSLPLEAMTRIGSPVNGPAMMKGFKKLSAEGFTHDDIRGMIDTFISKLRTKPLRPDVLAWRAFLFDLDSLAQSQRSLNPTETYGSWGTDSRLLEDE